MMICRSHQSCYHFLSFKNYNGQIFPPGAEPSWIPHTTLGPGTQVCLKAKRDPVLLSFISYKTHQILKNSVIIRPKRKGGGLKLNHSTWNNCYIPILSLSHLFLVSIVSSVEYSSSSTKRIHFLQNRTDRLVGGLLSVLTLPVGFYSIQLFLNGLSHQSLL